MWKPSPIAVTAALSLVAAFGAGWFANGWRLGEIHQTFRAEAAEAQAKGWETALRLYQTEQARADSAEREADAAARRLREQAGQHRKELLAAMKTGDCKAWADSPISCPVSW